MNDELTREIADGNTKKNPVEYGEYVEKLFGARCYDRIDGAKDSIALNMEAFMIM